MSQNRLGGEKSPYLLQHKNNPVWWYPWGAAAFEAATRENKPIFLSIGYSTCHWCHVMEKDSFEKDDVAKVLNENYISIKLDREERPDIDSVYMNAVQAMTGGGGWPMSVLMTPDGKPFWAGTFIPHDNFIGLLTQVANLWKTSRQQVVENGEKVFEFLRDNTHLPRLEKSAPSTQSLVQFFESFRRRYDAVHGGSHGAPKFPPALALSALLRVYRRTRSASALEMVEDTLKQMRRGGMYDQIGGGFHRYAVDDHWLVPHFEKMLYDNALLAVTYLEAFQVTKNPEYARTAREIFEYVLRDMTDKNGAFFSAEDADSEGIEGKFYVWSQEELERILSPAEFKEIKNSFHVTPDGNFHAHRTGDEVSEKRFEAPALVGNVLFLAPEAPLPTLNAGSKLLEIRSKRVRPHLDDKILTSWNGLMISALAKGFQVLGERKYLEAAQRATDFILVHLRDPQTLELKRSYRNGPSPHDALADDYANLIEALLTLYESDFDEKWFVAARELQEKQDQLFWDAESGGYFENDGRDKLVIIRHKNFEDGVVPSANGTAVMNLLRFLDFTGEMAYRSKADAVIAAGSVLLDRYPQACAKLLQGLDRLTDKSSELAIVGAHGPSQAGAIFQSVWRNFNPNTSVALSDGTGSTSMSAVPLLRDRPVNNAQPTFYFCRRGVCELPTNDPATVTAKLSEFTPYSAY